MLLALILVACFCIHDNSIGFRFLVDTGAEVSIVTPSHNEGPSAFKQSIEQTLRLMAYLDLGLRQNFRWVFIIADV